MTLTTAPCMLPNSADAPTDWICTSWMKSMPGSARASPLHGHVKFVPSMRNVFSFVPEPNADTLLLVPLAGDVGDTPGEALTKSNMLNRLAGMALRSSGPKRVSNPLPRASIREPAPSTTNDSSKPATLRTTVLSMVAPPPMPNALLVIAPEALELRCRERTVPEARAGNRSWPSSLVVSDATPPINAGELTRTIAPRRTPP